MDGHTAWIGGINYSADHLSDYGPEAKQDYAVKVRGPVVDDIYRFMLAALVHDEEPHLWWRRRFSSRGA
ncbi:hypothetical protein DZS_19550 [Dickeya ananatis]